MIDSIQQATGQAVSRETYERLCRYFHLLLAGNERQNLISRGSVADAWVRHIVDSAQLLRSAPSDARSWLDVGSGAGLPGIVAALLSTAKVTMVEPRRLRADFLQDCIEQLRLHNAVVAPLKVEKMIGRFDVISARAVAPIGELFGMSVHLADQHTRWLLPKGRTAAKELAEAQASWQGRFKLEPSVTASDASIVVAVGISPKGRARGKK